MSEKEIVLFVQNVSIMTCIIHTIHSNSILNTYGMHKDEHYPWFMIFIIFLYIEQVKHNRSAFP